MSGVLGGDARFRAALLADQLKTFLGAEDERRGREDSRHHAVGRDHADGLASVADGQAASRIQDMAIPAAIARKRSEIIARGRHRLIGQAYAGPAFARPVRFFKADVPGVLSGRTAADADVLTDV